MDYSLSKHQIADGVTAVKIYTENFKTACISFTFATNLSDRNGENALAAKLLLRSSKEYSDFTQIARKLAQLYGAELSSSVMKIAEQQVIRISISFIGDRFALDGESVAQQCLSLLLNLIFKPNIKKGSFDLEETESEKRLLLEQIESEKNDKTVYARIKLEQLMHENELYSINKFGDEKTIKKITSDTVAKAYANYLSKAVIRVNLVGEMNFDKAIELLKNGFSSIERNPEKIETLFIPFANDQKYDSETDEVKQGKLVIGLRAGMESSNDNYYAVRVMADLFGGGTYSKLFKVVREEMGLCYYCSASLIRQKGIILVQSGIETENEEKAKTAILAQLEDIRNGNFTDSDLKSSIDYLTDRFNSVGDTPEDLDYWFLQQIVTDELKTPEEYSENIRKVTREDVINAAKKATLDSVFMLKGTKNQEEKTNA
ncbi:MAG TPA: pitrilysin family protein [Oscillospiraceae bacterium]|nr:pitrilysin family protein [Oscillospiraceae bacterium]